MILIVTDKDPDYGADFLAHGFCDLLGASNVCDWPRKAGLHWTDPPEFDCNVNLDTAVLQQDEVETYLRERRFDLIVVPTLRGNVAQRLYFWRDLLRLNAEQLVYYDAEDHALDTRPLFVQMAGVEPASYFKREMPIGESWAQPLPFGYPEERCLQSSDRNGCVYSAYLWEWCDDSSLRRRLFRALTTEVDNVVTPNGRLPVSANHTINQRALVAVSPSGRGYHTNRHLEVIADGCALVVERPWRQWPNAPIHGVECFYFGDTLEAVEYVGDLLAEPERAREMAQAAQTLLRKRHTTCHRAEQVWQSIHGGVK